MNPVTSQTVQETAERFFSYLGTHLPVQCASDEFYFFPRAEAAVEHLGTLDDLHPDRIAEHLAYVSELYRSLPEGPFDHLDQEIDKAVLQESIHRFLWDYGSAQTWRNDPTLYIKIPLFAVDEILSRIGEPPELIAQSLEAILKQIPPFLKQGLENLHRPSRLSLAVATDMTDDAQRFFEKDVPLFIETQLQGRNNLLKASRRIPPIWRDFKAGLQASQTSESFAVGPDRLAAIFSSGLGYSRTPHEALDLANDAYVSTSENLKRWARSIDSCKTWQELIHEESDRAPSSVALLDLYTEEVHRLRDFFFSANALTLPDSEHVTVLPTPPYLQSLRATAAYRATLTGSPEGTGVFHITPRAESSGLTRAHVSYLSAHETYPGHHLLDTVRIRHPNPIRRQIEAPLFYEGWASYAETLLDDLGYITDPRRQLIQLQRQLWRDLRAILDVKLQTRMLTIAHAVQEIEKIGFSHDTALRQARRFAMTPGYQSCYFLGMYEIQRLKEKLADKLGLKRFHDILLSSGQIPFELVEEVMRMERRDEEKLRRQR